MGTDDRFQESFRSEDIHPSDIDRLPEDPDDTDHSGHVIDPVGPLHFALEILPCEDVSFHECEAVWLESLEDIRRSRAQVIDRSHYIALREMILGKMRSDEACAARDEDFHGVRRGCPLQPAE